MTILSDLIEADYGLEINGRWGRSEQHSSLVYDANRDIFYFNAQDVYGDAYIYLTKVRGWRHDEAKEYLRVRNYSTTFIQTIHQGEETITYPPLVDAFHENLLSTEDRKYFTNRKIKEDTIRRFKLGFYNNFYTIPIYQDGVLRQIQMRRDSPKLITHYYKDVGPVLFCQDNLKLPGEVYIVEGVMSCILVNQEGIPAVAPNLGSESFKPEWIKYFFGHKYINVLFDNDKAGNLGSIRIAKILGVDRVKIYNFWEFDKGYAVDDFILDGNPIDQLVARVEENGKFAYELSDYRK